MKRLFYTLIFLLPAWSTYAQQCWKTISAGSSHTVAIKPDGTLWAWGYNGSGQLGNGSTNSSSVPLQIGTATDWVQVSAGSDFTLALKADGTLWSWGDNYWGELGLGSSGDYRTFPTRIGNSTWKVMSAGNGFSLAVRSDGALLSWGTNFYGQLGYAAFTSIPTRVGASSDWRFVSAGGYHSAAIKENNTLWTWGKNSYGQLGQGSVGEEGPMLQVGTATNWQTISAGNEHNLALKTDGSLWAWGLNVNGQVGNGTNATVSSPVRIGTSTWKAVGAGLRSSIAINSNGTLWEWGDNVASSNPGNVSGITPAQLTNYTNWVSLSLGSYYAFAFQADKSLWSWGTNTGGNIGEEYDTPQPTPRLFSVGVPVGDGTQLICLGGTLADLKVTGPNIKWYSAATGGSLLASTTQLVHGTHYYASSTKHQCESVGRLDVLVNINATPTPTPTGPVSQYFCGSATIADLEVHGQNIKWYSSASREYVLPPETQLYNGAHYFAGQTLGGCESPVLLDVVAAVNTTPIPTATTNQAKCFGSTLADIFISGAAIKWYASETSNSPLPISTVLNEGASYYATQTLNNFESCERRRVQVSLIVVEPPTGDANQIICSDSKISTLKATGLNIHWYDSPVGGNLVDEATPVGNHHYYAEQINGCRSASRLDVQVTVNATPPPEYPGPAAFCAGATLADLEVIGTNVQWYDLYSKEKLPLTTELVHFNTYYATQTIDNFESCRSYVFAPVVRTTPTPVGDEHQYVCNSGTVANLLVDQFADIKWYGSPSGNDQLTLSTPLVDSKHYYAVKVGDLGCESRVRLDVTLHINTTLPPPVTGPSSQFTCGTTLASLVPNGENIRWYINATSDSELLPTAPLVDGQHYFVAQKIMGCESATRLEQTITLGTAAPPPTAVVEVDWKSVTSNFFGMHNIAIKNDGTLWGWGLNGHAQLGNGTKTQIKYATLLSIETWKVVESGSEHTVGIRSDGTLWYWGNRYPNIYGNAPVDEVVPKQIGTDNTWVKLAAGYDHTLAIKSDGSLWAWGENSNGKLGIGTYSSPSVPVQVGTDKDWVAIAASYENSFALKSNGTLWGMGVGNVIVPNPSDPHLIFPTRVGTNTWKTIVAGAYTFFGIQTDGSLWHWGRTYTPVGAGEVHKLTPTRLGNDNDWVQVSAGYQHAMGIKTNGTLWAAWGFNPNGELAQPPYYDHILPQPTQIGTAMNWKSVEAGHSRSVVMRTDGSLWACGYNEHTELGVIPTYDSYNIEDVWVDDLRPIFSRRLTGTCTPTTVADLQAAGANINWYADATSTSPLPLTAPLINGKIYFAGQTTDVCESKQRLRMIGLTASIPAPAGLNGEQTSGSETQYFCVGATVADIVVFATNVKWFDAPTGGSEISLATPLVNDQHYYATQFYNGCEPERRLDVKIVINQPEAPTGSPNQKLCYGSVVQSIVVSGSNIQWYSSPAGGVALLSNTALSNGLYYASQNINGCESQSRLEVSVVVGTVAPTGNASQSFCEVTVADLVATGNLIKWYETSAGGFELPASTVLVNNKHYYATQTLDGCESQARLDVAVQITKPGAPVGDTSQKFCNIATIADLEVIGADVKWYSNTTGGDPLAATLQLVSGQHYYASQTVDGCESFARLDVTAVIAKPTAPTGAPSQQFCNDATIADLTAVGEGLKWYTDAVGGALIETAEPLVSNSHYYASKTVDGCESWSRLDVVAVITTTPDAPTGNSEQTFCNSSVLSDVVLTGSGIVWYDDPTSGNILPSSTILSDEQTYFASQTNNGCESTMRFEVKTLITITPPPTVQAMQEVEAGSVISDLEISGDNIEWYESMDDANGGVNKLLPGTILSNNQSYYATQTIDVCRSEPAVVTVALIVIQGLEPAFGDLQVYPNPVEDLLLIENATIVDHVALTDVTGKKLIETMVDRSQTSLSLSGFAPGVYFLQISLDNHVVVRKIIKR